MSYDLAVWEGERPADNVAVGKAFTLYSCHIAVDEGFQPSPCIAECVAGLLARLVDRTQGKEGISPWSMGPLIRDAAGPFIYFSKRYSMAEEASAYVAELAASMGLACYGPRLGRCGREDCPSGGSQGRAIPLSMERILVTTLH
ncbi:hypothetical protein ACFV47_09280 [Streptomyces solisilvae]|uniref:hypothetical protein n=1 Tax=Streptomyces malaysiensis TaxID=92644 RepID=UPI0036787ED6